MYTCTAANIEGEDTKQYDLIVHEPPRINGPSRDAINVNLDDNFVLNCQVEGFPVPAVTWYKDGRKLRQTDYLVISNDGRQLLVTTAQLDDAGSYVCNASNVQGYDTKTTAVNIRVPPKIDPNVESIWVQEGWNWNLTCDVRSNSVVDITWKKNGVDIKTSSRARTIQNGRKLMLFDMQRQDAAAYTCVASNAAGDAEQSTNVDVYTLPSITNADEVDKHIVIQGESVTMECIVDGYSKPKIQWSKDFIPIGFDEFGSSSSSRFKETEDF